MHACIRASTIHTYIVHCFPSSLIPQESKIYAVDIRNIVAFGRQACDSDLDMRAYSLNLTQGNLTLTSPATGTDLSARAVDYFRMDEMGYPVLSEYILSR